MLLLCHVVAAAVFAILDFVRCFRFGLFFASLDFIHCFCLAFPPLPPHPPSSFVESSWVEISHSKLLSLLVGFIYGNPTATYAWYDEFLVMLDKAADSKKNILLLDDLNIDLSKSHSAWESTYSLVGLHQLVNKPTGVTRTTDTLIDLTTLTN